MADQAKVYSIDAIQRFRERLAAFGDDVRAGLVGTEMEVRRTLDFVLREQPIHWQGQLKRRSQKLADAKAELFRRKLSAASPADVHDADQRELVRRAEVLVHEAETKLEAIKRWAAPLQQAVDEYHGQSRSLDDLAGAQLEHALALLERMIAALEEYTGSGPPPGTS